jgi:aminomethyltransferase
MGRFSIHGSSALPFLQCMLTNNAAALKTGRSQYTFIPNERGGAIDDAYLYRFDETEYLLVVNAANRDLVREHLTSVLWKFENVTMIDHTEKLSMLSLQGPLSESILLSVLDGGRLPDPIRNYLSTARINNAAVHISRTGYTGEPVCFELFVHRNKALKIWDLLLDKGAKPIGLGARDTLRLEAGLPLYGHELGIDPEGKEIPIFSSKLSRFAVSFSPLKGDFVGRQQLERQAGAFKGILDNTFINTEILPRMVMPVALLEKGVARAGNPVFRDLTIVGYVTSGTMVPYWKTQKNTIEPQITDTKGLRAIGLALLDSNLKEGDEVHIEIRNKRVRARIVPHHLKNDTPPFTRPILWQ